MAGGWWELLKTELFKINVDGLFKGRTICIIAIFADVFTDVFVVCNHYVECKTVQ